MDHMPRSEACANMAHVGPQCRDSCQDIGMCSTRNAQPMRTPKRKTCTRNRNPAEHAKPNARGLNRNGQLLLARPAGRQEPPRPEPSAGIHRRRKSHDNHRAKNAVGRGKPRPGPKAKTPRVRRRVGSLSRKRREVGGAPAPRHARALKRPRALAAKLYARRRQRGRKIDGAGERGMPDASPIARAFGRERFAASPADLRTGASRWGAAGANKGPKP